MEKHSTEFIGLDVHLATIMPAIKVDYATNEAIDDWCFLSPQDCRKLTRYSQVIAEESIRSSQWKLLPLK